MTKYQSILLALCLTCPGLANADSSTATDANTIYVNCAVQEGQACAAANPTDGPSASADVCNSTAQLKKVAADCTAAKNQFCAQATTDSFLPPGCSAPHLSALVAQPTPTPTPNPQPPVTNSVTPDLTQAQADLASCQAQSTTASSCCGNPQSCGGVDTSAQQTQLVAQAKQAYDAGDTASLQQICNQTSQNGNLGADMNNSFTQVCSASHNGCSVACSQYVSKWQAQLPNCTGSCDSGKLTNLISQMSSSKSSCDGLQSAENNYKQLAMNSANNAGAGQYCSQSLKAATGTGTSNPTGGSATPSPFNSGSMNPSSINDERNRPSANNPIPSLGSSECGTAANVGNCMDCSRHPEFPSCGGDSSDSDSMRDAVGTGPSGPSTILGANELNDSSPGAHIRSRQAMENANGSQGVGGHGMLGGGPSASVTGVFSLPPQPAPRAGATATAIHIGLNTDILHGENGASVIRTSSGTGYEPQSNRMRGLSAISAPTTDRNYVGMDLKKYLPGAQQYNPGGRQLAAMPINSPEIGPVSVDLFQRVSQRFRLLCSSENLLDCN